MEIAAEKVVKIHYTLTNDDGQTLDSSREMDPLEYLHGAQNIIAGLENSLTGKTVGSKLNVTVDPNEGYGMRDEKLLMEIPREQFGELEVEKGMQFQSQVDGQMMIFTVLDSNETGVQVDGNHPLAGERLHFDVEVIAIREATADEIQHGHIHATGGCGCGDPDGGCHD